MRKKNKKRVLICIGDTAGGHISAANAMTKAFASLYPDDFEVKVIDLYRETDIPPFNKLSGIYVTVNKNIFMEFFYNLGGWIGGTGIVFPFYRGFVLYKMKKASKKIIDAFNPDIIISNNAIITPIIEALKKDGALWKSAVLVTDIACIFRGWADCCADLVISPTEEAARRLLHYKVDKKRITSPLFPINPSLARFLPREKVLKKLGLAVNGKNTVLVTSGGFGVAALEKPIKILLNQPLLQVIVLAGRIEEYKTDLENRFADYPNIKILGFVDNIQDYYNAADIIVGKPGPATIMEIELFRKKAILTASIGFQEKGNIDIALMNPNFRTIGKKWHLLPKYVEELLNQDEIPFPNRRQFDESKKIVQAIVKLLDK